MIKLQYRPPEIRDKSHGMPFVPGGGPLCSEHVAAAENCTCGMPDDVPAMILRSDLKQRRPGG